MSAADHDFGDDEYRRRRETRRLALPSRVCRVGLREIARETEESVVSHFLLPVDGPDLVERLKWKARDRRTMVWFCPIVRHGPELGR